MQKRNACANDIKNIVRNIMHSDMSSGKKLNELNDLEMSISSLLNANSKISNELSPLNQEITESKFKIRIKDPEKLKQKIDEYRTSVKEELKFFLKSEMKTLVKLNTYFDKYDMDCRFDFYDNDGNVSFEKISKIPSELSSEIYLSTLTANQAELFNIMANELAEDAKKQNEQTKSLHSERYQKTINDTNIEIKNRNASIAIVGEGIIDSKLRNKKIIDNTGPDLDV